MDNTVPLKVQEAIFDQLLDHAENKVCADCPNKSPTWTSIDFGVFICLRCAGVHRQLGPNVTLVQSAKLDSWKMDKIEILAAVGNKIANNYWEHSLPSYYRRPDITTSMEDVRRMVNDKYIKRLYANKDARNPVEEFVEARKNSQMTAGAFRQLKLEQINGVSTQSKKNTVSDAPIKKEPEQKAANKNLLDFEDDDNGFENFKSAPVQTVNLNIPKADVEFKFSSNNGTTQKTQNTGSINLMNMNFEATMPTTSTSLHKANSDPFQFTNTTKPQQTQQFPNTSNIQRAQSNEANIYNMYKTGDVGNSVNTSQQQPTKNYSGGQSNYAYLDMLGQSQQNRFNQPQGFNYQSNFGGQGNFYGGTQYNSGGFGSQNTGTKPSSGFDFTSSNKGFGGGFNSGGGYPTNSSSGFNSTGFSGGAGFNSGTQGSFDFKSTNTIGTQSQQVGFTSNTTTNSASFNFSTGTNSNTFSQPSNSNSGFSFF